MRALWQDLLVSLRNLRREPLSALITSLTLALGIGLCSTVFSLNYGVFLRGLDVPEADRLIMIDRIHPERATDGMSVSVHDFHDWREQQRSFEGLAGYYSGTVNLSGTEGPERYNGAFVSADLFRTLRVAPVLGGDFREADDDAGAPLTLILGHQVWTERYRADPTVIGQSVIVNGEGATILGVMPEGFLYPENQQLWVALRDNRGTLATRGQGQGMDVIARYRDGVTEDQAGQEMAAIAARIAEANPEPNEGVTTRLRTVTERMTGSELRTVFGALQVATIFVLLIAIANVANLLMARATLRTREAAVRNALGASRLRIVLPFFAETLVLSGIGALIGLGIAQVGVTLFDGATRDVGKPYFMVFALDLPVLAFVAGVTLVTALLAGSAPAFHILRTNISATLKDEGRGSSGVLGGRLTRALVVAEIALSCALLVGAGLMAKSILRFRNFQYPFATENVLTARVGLFEAEYPTAEGRRVFWDELGRRLAELPGTRAAALTTSLPLNGGPSDIGFEGETYEGDGDYPRAISGFSVTPGFFATFGAEVVEGRDFTVADMEGSQPVAIVNEAFVARHFAGKEPLGQRFAERTGRTTLGPWMTIVGVVPNLRMEGLDPDRPDPWGYYVPLAQRDPRFVSMAVQVAGGDPMAVARGVREAVRSLNPNLPIYNVESMATVARRAGWFLSVFGSLFIAFGAAALFMATVGLYGVLSFSVSRRIREMGIRMALGASPPTVVRMIMQQGARQLAVGLGLGLLMAFGLTRLVAILMFEVTPQDPPVFTGVTILIATVGMLASFIPARQATRAEPTAALRAE
jgi:predicted permease